MSQANSIPPVNPVVKPQEAADNKDVSGTLSRVATAEERIWTAAFVAAMGRNSKPSVAACTADFAVKAFLQRNWIASCEDHTTP